MRSSRFAFAVAALTLAAEGPAPSAGPADSAAAATPPTVYVTFWFDTEDYILPDADDAAKRLADIFTRHGARATFKIVGEKARVLCERGRTDVIEALANHDIGYHTDFHSVHPTPSEYSRDPDWDEGVAEFLRREGPGLDFLRELFGDRISCYGQPGGSWTPQSYGALRQWQIPVYLDDTPHVGWEGKPFWYGGVLNALNLEGYTTRSDLDSDEELHEGCRRFDEIYKRCLDEGGGLISIYYHPCEWVHEQFWDGVNFSRGNSPPRSEWKWPPQKPPEVTECWFRNFERYLEHVRRCAGVKIVTASEISELYRDGAYDRPFGASEAQKVATALREGVSFVSGDERALSAAEAAFLLARAAVLFDERGQRPSEISIEFAFGPSSAPGETMKDLEVPWPRWVEACRDFLDARRKLGRMPSVVWVAGRPVDPIDFAATLAAAADGLLRDEKAPASVRLVRGNFSAGRFVAGDGPGLWGWVIFPEGFRAPKMMAIARLQAWTLKPAVRAR